MEDGDVFARGIAEADVPELDLALERVEPDPLPSAHGIHLRFAVDDLKDLVRCSLRLLEGAEDRNGRAELEPADEHTEEHRNHDASGGRRARWDVLDKIPPVEERQRVGAEHDAHGQPNTDTSEEPTLHAERAHPLYLGVVSLAFPLLATESMNSPNSAKHLLSNGAGTGIRLSFLLLCLGHDLAKDSSGNQQQRQHTQHHQGQAPGPVKSEPVATNERRHTLDKEGVLGSVHCRRDFHVGADSVGELPSFCDVEIRNLLLHDAGEELTFQHIGLALTRDLKAGVANPCQ
mmetsp:Transcript_1606/g.2910  ORF Transcript_1606/g.2910 Transcript_1606/m.2910 type:complete len:290 (+) Transcript_1606:2086-2955(+)